MKLVELARYARNSHLSWKDFTGLMGDAPPIGELPGDPLARLGVSTGDLASSPGRVEFLGQCKYLNGALAVVCHTVDDSNEQLPACLDVMDRYGIKATAFVTTGYRSLMPRLWPRLREAIANGHEIGSHSRRHPCRIPESSFSCFRALTADEIEGSRNDILENTGQPYVWSWAYPCGNCAGREFVQRKLARAGYLMARAYPDELRDQHALPDLQTYDSNPYAARYTQVIQKSYTKKVADRGDITISGRTDVAALNAKFDEVHGGGGIYSFMTHPQMIDYGAQRFYERHLAHVGRRNDVWYVPMGPLYAYRNLSGQTQVQALRAGDALARFAVFNRLDPKIYNGSVTLRFRSSNPLSVMVNGKEIPEQAAGPVTSWQGQYFRRDGEDLLVTVQTNRVVEFQQLNSGSRIS